MLLKCYRMDWIVHIPVSMTWHAVYVDSCMVVAEWVSGITCMFDLRRVVAERVNSMMWMLILCRVVAEWVNVHADMCKMGTGWVSGMM